MVNFATALQQYGWEPTVITPDVNDGWMDSERLSQIDGVEVVRTGSMSRQKRTLVQKVAGRLVPLDPHFPWAFKALKAASKLEPSRFDLVFTSGPPHSVHYAGLRLSRKFNLKWVADFRDPYTLAPEYRAFSPLNFLSDRYFEKQIYRHADFVVTNTRTNRREVLQKFDAVDPGKLVTINNGFDERELVDGGLESPWTGEKLKPLNYVYLGGLRGYGIDRYFFEGLREALASQPQVADEFAIRIVGDVRHQSDIVRELVDQGIVTLHAPVDSGTIGSVLARSDAGLIWHRNDTRYHGQIPQKFFEYFGSRTPIFYVGPKNNEVGKVCRRFDVGVVAEPVSVNEVADGFLNFHRRIQNQELDYSKCPERLFSQFSRPEHAKKLACVFERALGATGRTTRPADD